MGKLFFENNRIIFRRGEDMNRQEFMRRLEQLLEGIPEEEKREAIAYYTSYFEDAGEENEEKIIRELESPEKVAATIRADFPGCNNSETASSGNQQESSEDYLELQSAV
jgi:uncharacterized membrane protein